MFVIIAASVVFMMLSIPISLAAVSSLSIGDNTVYLSQEPLDGGVSVVPGEYIPYVIETTNEGKFAHSIQIEENDSNCVPGGSGNAKIFSLTIPANVPFCLYVENKNWGLYKAEMTIKLIGTQYVGTSNSEGKYYFSTGNATGYTMNPVSDINNVNFMTFNEDVTFEINGKRVGLWVYAELKLQIVYG